MKRLAPSPAVVLVIVVGGCARVPSVLDPHGAQAGRIDSLWWLFFWVCAVVYAITLAWLAYALLRRRRRTPELDRRSLPPEPRRERRASLGLAAWTVATVLILVGLTIASYATDKRLAALIGRQTLTIEVTANQWWWQVRYPDPDPSRSFATANEIHIPVGTPVRVRLRAQDVIHSFWVPNLHGKQDLIPGRDNDIYLVADREGVFRGQCAEFCGMQDAHMAFEVIAQPPDEFAAWRAAQLLPAADPEIAEQRQGREVFLSSACIVCHSVRGTRANGRTGPDLTHLASRRTIAAGTLPNSPGNLAGWIIDPQRIKPGNHMPMIDLAAGDLQAVLAYLDGLK